MKVRASVLVTIEVPANSAWGPDCTVDQIRNQAMQDVDGRLRRLLKEPGIVIQGMKPKVIVIEED